jgi:hypothetical protein
MGFFHYVRAAFSARPWGMWVPPNWVGLAAFGMLGLVEPGFWLLGAGLELGYLITLASSKRFQRFVDSRASFGEKQKAQKQLEAMLVRLDLSDQDRYKRLEKRCEMVLQQQHDASPADLQLQADGLGKLAYVYLRLLVTRTGILRVLEGGSSSKSIDMRIKEVNGQLKSAASAELQKSLTDQLDILAERKKRHEEAREKLRFIEAELTRIEEQIELIREGLAMASDAGSLSRRIDAVGNSLGTTTNWIRQQQAMMGETEDLLNEPPPVALKVPQPSRN